VDDMEITNEETPVVISVLANDSDADTANPLTAELVSLPSNGSLVDGGGGDYTYTPFNNFFGTDTFVYRAVSTTGQSATALVAIDVTNVNDVPVAVDDFVTTLEDTPVDIFILNNDSDGDPGELNSAAITTTAPMPLSSGTITESGGVVNFTPALNFVGTVTFTYTLDDGTAVSPPATVTITVITHNEGVTAVPDNFSLPEDSVDFPLDVVGNDDDPDINYDTRIVTILVEPQNGVATIDPNDNLTVLYTPNPDYFGPDSFEYTLSTSSGDEDSAVVTLDITAVSDAIVATDDFASTYEDTPVVINVLQNDYEPDGDTVTLLVTTPPSGGIATVIITVDGPRIEYTPGLNFNDDVSTIPGQDSFVYTADDGTATSSATVTMSVVPRNDPIFPADDTATTPEEILVNIDVLSNDNDPDGDTLIVTIETWPSNGTAVVLGDNTIDYTPNTDFVGTDTFTYTVTTDAGDTGTATVTVDVTAIEDGVTAVDDFASTIEDTSVTIFVLNNDINGDNDPLQITNVSATASGGTAMLNPDNSITFTPALHYVGNDNFTYTVEDVPAGNSSTATVNVEIHPQDDSVQANDDIFVLDEDTTVSINVAANDFDFDNDTTFTISIVTRPNNGRAIVDGATQEIIYTPHDNYNGNDSLVYAYTDPTGNSDTATLSLTINPIEDGVTANPDSVSTAEDTPVTIFILTNDVNVDNDILTVTLFQPPPAEGFVMLNGDNSVTFTPVALFTGISTFTYEISDNNTPPSSTTVSVTVVPVNNGIVAIDDVATVNEDNVANIDVIANDVNEDADPLTISISNVPANGTAIVNGGIVEYSPHTDFNGIDSFEYTISTPDGDTSSAIVTVTVDPVNDPIFAENDNVSTPEDTPITIFVLANDRNPDNDSMDVISVTSPTLFGVAVFNADNTITYTPNPHQNGIDSFDYTIASPDETDTATVTVNVFSVYDRAIAVDDTATTPEDLAVLIDVLANDSSPDGNTLTVVSVTTPLYGTATIVAGGVNYVPNPNFHGIDSFSYVVFDGTSNDIAEVIVTVTPVNDGIIATDDSAVTREDVPVIINVLVNDVNVDNDALQVSIVTQPTNGSVFILPDGKIRYTPAPDFFGVDTFEYLITSPNNDQDTAIVTVTTVMRLDEYIAVDDLVTTNKSTNVTISLLSNDQNPDSIVVSSFSITQPDNGIAVIDGNTVIYSPIDYYIGTDSFVYTVNLANGDTDTAVVYIVVSDLICACGTALNITSQRCDPCEMGLYSPFGSTCISCPPGFFTESEGQCVCTDCGPGRGSGCGVCLPGTYSPGSGGCIDCPFNQVSENFGAAKCTHCPCGMQIVNSTACEHCPNNFFSNEGEYCQLCPPGFIAGEGQCTCTDCGPGLEAADPDGNGILTCEPCAIGMFSPGTGQCTSCPPGFVSPATGAIECHPCPCGYEANQAASTCDPCLPGDYSTGGEQCDHCPAGTYTGSGHCECYDCGGGFESDAERINCVPCSPGNYSAGLGPCVNCPTGTVAPAGSVTCYTCECGLQALEDQSGCELCPTGQFSSGGGMCDICPPGSVSEIEGQCECSPCGIGFEPNPNRTRCEPCPRGFFSVVVGGFCLPCPAGFISEDGIKCEKCPCGTEHKNISLCSFCEPGKFSNDGGPCEICPQGTYASRTGQCTCDSCGAGFQATFDRLGCEQCPAGTFSSGGGSCTECPTGTVALEGSPFCFPCLCGTEPSENKTDCIYCAAGTFSPDGGNCETCPPGSISPAAQCECRGCDPGFQPNAEKTICEPCPAGTFSKGHSECASCPLGFFSNPGASICEPCPCGQTASVDGSTCIDCPVGQFSDGKGGACSICPGGTIAAHPGQCVCQDCGAGSQAVGGISCELCPPGQFSVGFAQCQSCPKGTTAQSPGASECTACSCGSSSNSDGSLCVSCPAGTYSDGGSNCQACPVGAYSTAGSCECTECGAGLQADSTRTTCQPCPPGSYSPGDGECQLCTAGSISTSGADSCTECECGFQPNSQHSACTPCPGGSFSDFGGLCQLCPGNKIAPGGSCHCEDCPPGTQATVDNSACTECPPGTFSAGGSLCQSCPSGSFSSLPGAAECHTCAPGSQPNSGATSCTVCPAGTYSSDGISCQSCPSGSISSAGSFECTICGCGFEAVGGTQCVACPPGEYSTFDGACQECSDGTVASTSGSCSCISCPPGKEANSNHITCDLCLPGTFSSNGEVCQPCQPGSASSDFGATECAPCPIGHGDTTNPSICGDCPPSFSSGVGETCSSCLSGQVSHSGGPCVDCPPGYGSINRDLAPDVCGPCPDGSSSELGGECVRCAEGFIAQSTGPCKPCQPGHEPNREQSFCVACPQGTFSRNGEPCIPCLQGTISNGPGASHCSVCPAGFTSNSKRTTCVACQAGFTSVAGGTCVECQGGSTSQPGGPCEECAPGNGDTSKPGTCLPCDFGHSSERGGICVKCRAGQEAFPGGACVDCPAGYGAEVGGLCSPCKSGQSSIEGGSCVDCPPGQFSYSGGLCRDCSSGYSSTGGSDSCFQCPYGQVSVEGGQCLARCQAGQAWSYIFQQCAVCPKDTFSVSGDTACTRCPDNTYAPDGSSACWTSGRIGGKMRITADFNSFYLPDWVHCVAVLLDSEVNDIVVLRTHPGSTIIDFELKDPTVATIAGESSQIRELSGNEKMLLLYQWWVTRDTKMEDFTYDIIDFKVYTETAANEELEIDSEVVELFASAPLPYLEFPPRPDIDTSSPAGGVSSGFYFDQATLQITISVGEGNSLVPNLLLFVSFLLCFFTFLY